jgi:decaprenyl-phosphate phosphoribosyltransferase
MMLRYAHHVEQGGAEAPEDVVLGDRVLQMLALVWVALFAAQIP